MAVVATSASVKSDQATDEAEQLTREDSSNAEQGADGFGAAKFDYWAISAVYFLYFASNSCLVPFFSVFYTSQGLTPSQVGILLALRPAAMLFAGPIAGNIADQLGTSKPVLMVQLCMGAALRMCLRLSSDFGVLCMIVLFAESVASGFAPVLDGHVMKVLHSVGQEAHYGRMRLWGAVGWGLFSVVSGSAQSWDLFGLGQNVMFLLNITIACIAAVALYRMPGVPQSERVATAVGPGSDASTAPPSPGGQGGAPGGLGGVEGGDTEAALSAAAPVRRPPSKTAALRVLLQPYILCFGVTVLCMGMLMGIITNFLFIWLEEQGGGANVMGWSLFFTCVSEVPLFHFSGALIARFGNTVLLVAALVCYGVRLVAYSFLSNAWAVLPIELLHGVTFGVGWACCVAFAAEIAPPGLGSTVQGVLAGIHWGIGNSIGAIVGGFAYAAWGGQRTWWACEALVAVGLAAAAATIRLSPGGNGKATAAASSYAAVQWDETDVLQAENQTDSGSVSLELARVRKASAADSEEEVLDTVV
mgnify:CR=1 FL=1